MISEKLSVLIVEDEIFASKYLLNILKSLRLSTIYEASNAKEALQIVQNQKIDLVFMDININGAIDGIKCSQLLNEQYFIPTIYTTAYSDSNTIDEASKTNLFSYLVKPFEPHEVEVALTITLKMIKLKTKEKKEVLKNENIIFLNDNLTFNTINKTILKLNNPINITKKEQDLLYIFCKNLNQNISYETLKLNIWGNTNIANSTIRDAISKLKKKIPDLKIENIANFGYILKDK